LNAASSHNIPSGFRKDFIPGLPADAKHLIKQRDELRVLDPCDPEIPTLNDNIAEAIHIFKRQKWTNKLNSSTHRADPSKFWPLLKHLSGKSSRPPPNQPISFKNKPYTRSSVIAFKFCKQYSSVVPHKSNKNARKVIRTIKSKHVLIKDLSPFSVANVEHAIRISKNSSAVGPDGLTALHLKHLGPQVLSYLTELFNLSINYANLPVVWKQAIIIPVLKPGKPADQGLSYRPISLLSPVAKILERLIKPDIVAALPKHKSQHAYSPMHSTTTALLPLATQIAIAIVAPPWWP
jgi:hypothetical protein